ncbi:MAG: pyridoxine 5'-phosphate synthase [Thermodesulfovibrionales bacterium]|nr:pyridoxine 5'-phosphate synthase [Thermodesulfovibrionales bacterium]
MILGVNVDHVATLRQARLATEPEPLMAATLAILGGADGITVHLREDRRHINDRDLWLMRELISCELNLEMAATPEMTDIALEVGPDMVTLVPEKRQELTTEGGLDLRAQRAKLRAAIKKLKDRGIPVSLFVNPEKKDIEASKAAGADMVEIHTGMYANAKGPAAEAELKRIYAAAGHALDAGLSVNAGHGLNYFNVMKIAEIKGLRGLYIGHSIISRAVLVGMERAVREMKGLIGKAA